jgi:hypothetical protein
MYELLRMAKTFADLIGTWPRRTDEDGRKLTSIATFAADVGVAYYHAQTMRYRNSISVEYWPAVIKAAKKRGRTLTHEQLGRLRGASRKNGARPRYRMPEACAS